jgi:hypothetical protein
VIGIAAGHRHSCVPGDGDVLSSAYIFADHCWSSFGQQMTTAPMKFSSMTGMLMQSSQSLNF